MAFLFRHEIPVDPWHLEDGSIISWPYSQRSWPLLTDFSVQLFDRSEIDRLINVVMQVDKQSMHQRPFNRIHFLPPLDFHFTAVLIHLNTQE